MRLRVPVQLRWSDMDAYGHVNNVEMLTLLEEARIEAFWAHPAPAPGPAAAGAPTERERWPTAVLDAGPGARTATLVARQEIEYLRPLGYRRTPVVVDMWIGHLGGASIDVCYEVHDTVPAEPAPGATAERVTPYARAVTTLVLVDAASGSPRRIGQAERAAWLPYVEEPPTFRRRGR